MDDLKKYIEELDAALTTLDMEWAAQQMPYSAPEVRLMALHKARCECQSIEPHLRTQSQEWLQAGGHSRLDGWPLLPVTPNVKVSVASHDD